MLRILIAACIGSALLLPAVAPPKHFSLTHRLPFTTSKVIGTPEPPPTYRTRRVFEKVAFKHPVYAISHPKHDRLFVVEQNGRIRSLKPGGTRADTFLSLPDADTTGMAFHPKYEKNGFVYVFSMGPNSAKKKKNAIVRYTASGDPPECDPKSRKVIIEWESNGHNGGDLAFAKDGMLYITSGDGTSDSDGDATGQDLRDLCSGILRIDVNAAPEGKGYAIPKDNPFVKVKDARPELWAFGLRNPWRMTVDPVTNDMYIADVGQDLWEMVYLGKKGANYGWAIREGRHPFHAHHKQGPAPFVDPLIEHPHSESRSITGGVVYRGQKLPELVGAYIYGDFATGKIWGLRHKGGKVTWKAEVAQTRMQIVGFGIGPDEELYIVDHGSGLHILEKAPSAPPGPPFPRKLSETGLFADLRTHQPAVGLIPYGVNSPLWSDGADKDRFLAIPGRGQIIFSNNGFWGFPDQTVLVKTFRFGHTRIETRLMHKQDGGEWVGYSYAWNARQSDALLVEAVGRDVPNILGTKHLWRFPSRAECMVCHSRAANYVLGLCTSQINGEYEYAGVRKNQLKALEGLGVFSVSAREHVEAWKERGEALTAALKPRLPKAAWDRIIQLGRSLKVPTRDSLMLARLPDEFPRLAPLDDASASLEHRARSYLHSNCANCHVWAGGGNAAILLDINTPLDKMRVVNVDPMHDTFGVKNPKLIAPGDPDRSILLKRLATRGKGRMPPLASHQVDPAAVRLIGDWIRSMK